MVEPAEGGDRLKYFGGWEWQDIVGNAVVVGVVLPLLGLLGPTDRDLAVYGFICGVFGFACSRVSQGREVRRLVEPDQVATKKAIEQLYGQADVAIAIAMVALFIAPVGRFLYLAIAALGGFQIYVLARVRFKLPPTPRDLQPQWKLARDGYNLLPDNRGPAAPPLSFNAPEEDARPAPVQGDAPPR